MTGPDWFNAAMIGTLSGMLAACGYQLMDSARVMHRQNKTLDRAVVTSREMMDFILFQRGLLIAMQAGVIAPWMLEPVDLRNLPVEMRVAIWRSLLDIGIEAYKPPEETKNGQAQAGA